MNCLVLIKLVRKCCTLAFLPIAGVIFGLTLTVPSAYAQGKCSLQTITGTYVGYERGSSAVLNLSPQPNPPTWTASVFLPFANIFEYTIKPDGTADGFFWIWAGSIGATVDPIPVHLTITEMNPDCTGKVAYTANLPGRPPTQIEERFIVFDNGREFRSVPTVTGIPGVAWIGTGQRISNGLAPVTFGGPQTAHGTYLVSCENYIGVNPTTGVADAFLLRMDVSMSGDYTGKLYEKLGQMSIDGHDVNGTISVNPDFSFTNTLNLPDLNSTVIAKGVFFNEGHDLYSVSTSKDLPTGVKYSICQGTRVGQ